MPPASINGSAGCASVTFRATLFFQGEDSAARRSFIGIWMSLRGRKRTDDVSEMSAEFTPALGNGWNRSTAGARFLTSTTRKTRTGRGEGSDSLDSEKKLVASSKYFDIPPTLLEQLRARRAARSHPDAIEDEHDAFLLDPGLGPSTYLTADGRILWDDAMWGVEAGLGPAYAAILVGARKTGIADLRQLLPVRPSGARNCPECAGTGLLGRGEWKDVNGRPMSVGCPGCWGMGWQAIAAASR